MHLVLFGIDDEGRQPLARYASLTTKSGYFEPNAEAQSKLDEHLCGALDETTEVQSANHMYHF